MDRLTPREIAPATSAILRILDARWGTSYRSSDEQSIAVRFVEYPDRLWWPTHSCEETLLHQLGPTLDRWVGRLIPLRVTPTRNPQTGEVKQILAVEPESDWVGTFRRYAAQQEAESR